MHYMRSICFFVNIKMYCALLVSKCNLFFAYEIQFICMKSANNSEVTVFYIGCQRKDISFMCENFVKKLFGV